MNLQIFDVEHGACALLTIPNRMRLMIDCGHNGETGWAPCKHLQKLGIQYIDALAITNCDEDHVSGLPKFIEKIRVGSLWRNTSVTAQVLRSLKAAGGIGQGINSYISMLSRNGSINNLLKSPSPNIKWQVFYNEYPYFKDTNNLSMVIHLQIDGVNFLFPGDLEAPGWARLLKQQEFCKVVRDTNVLVASHHGRESGIHDEIFTDHGCKPYFVVISDKCHMHDTQKTVDYYSTKTRGGSFRNGEKRHVLTTRRDGALTFSFDKDGWSAH